MSSSSPPTTIKQSFLSNVYHSPSSSFYGPSNSGSSTGQLTSTSEYNRGFAAGVASIERKLKEQAEASKREVEKVREQLSKRRGSVMSFGSMSEEGGSAIMEENGGGNGDEARVGIDKRDSFREQEERIKAVERSFGIRVRGE
ncbi:hypothetical protein BGZ60DRAFT_414851 [Tricladium varicosporioides]|nr:hypothetical protein BGZ60DRAFT_414851 [Hymenoscyphus varicosporioides]